MPYILGFQFINILGISVFQNGGLVVIIAIIAGLYKNGQKLDEAMSMSLLAMVFFVFLSVNMFFYYAMTTLQAFLAIIRRVSSVFDLEEHASKRSETTGGGDDQPFIKFDNCDFSWGFRVAEEKATAGEKKDKEESEDKAEGKKETGDKVKQPKEKAQATTQDKFKLKTEQFDKHILSSINFQMSRGDFLAVIGQVGSGKSSLLHSIMDETILKSGNKEVCGSIAYVEQEPFIFSGSVKENILFGKPYDEQRFALAVQASQLTSDLEILGNGANTQIGERGINISGGQKARISLARAVYSNADIVLLDDPLSAVDPKVAKSIFSDCIRGALQDKIVILVTHQLQFLEDCPQIMLLKNGRVSCFGSHSELVATGYNIKDILDSYNKVLMQTDGEKAKFEDEVEKSGSEGQKPSEG